MRSVAALAVLALIGCDVVTPTEPGPTAQLAPVPPVAEPTLPPVVSRTPATPTATPTKTPVPFATPANCGPGGFGYSDEPPFGCIAYCPCNSTPTPTPPATPTPTPTPTFTATPCTPFQPC